MMRQASFVGVCFGVFALVAATVGTGAPLLYERFENSAVGTIAGGVTFSTDVVAPTVDSGGGVVANDYTAVFDGADGTYVTHGTGTQVTSTNFTVEGFISVADTSAYRTIASDWGQTAGETRSWAFFVTDTGALRLDVSPNGNYYSNNRLMTGDGIIQTDKWYHVAAVSEGNVSRIYLDGVVVASMTRGTTGGPYTSDNANLKVGNIDHSGGGNTQEPFNGSIDELRIDNGAALGRDDFIKSS
ncbi:LamG domain-containing protein, partial [bacterium]|nr:LamG domain-containing protein [bacterium]